MPSITFTDLAALARTHQLFLHGFSDLAELSAERAQLERWQGRGFAGEMKYMLRSPALLAAPQALLPVGRSVIVFGIPYENRPAPPRPEGFGRVARYAWGLDYHRVLRERLAEFIKSLEAVVGKGLIFRIFTDAVPLLERALAAKAGLGFVGKNTLLIRPRSGSFFFLTEVLSNLEIRGETLPIFKENCGSCVRCQTSCPTGAIVEPYAIDSRRCISYLTIEKRGSLLREERSLIGEWVFGCDVCQEVCPFNHSPQVRGVENLEPHFAAQCGVGPLLSLSDLLQIRTGSDFNKRFQKTPLMRARRSGLLRNAAVVAGNTKTVSAVPALRSAFTEDSSAVVRQHSLWALAMIGGLSREDKKRAFRDPDELVRHEAAELETAQSL